MRRRTLLFPLLALACCLAPSTLSGQVRPLTGVFQVSPESYGSEDPGRYETHMPVAAALSDGTFLAAWEEDLEIEPSGGGSEHFDDLYLRKIGPGGQARRLLRLDRGTEENGTEPILPALAADGQGGFAIAWERLRLGASDILFQGVPPDQLPREGQLLHPDAEASLDRSPSVAANASGDAVIAWEEWLDPQGLRRAIGVRPFRAFEEDTNPDFRIESPNPQVRLIQPRVAIQEDGSFLVAWGVITPFGTRVQGQSFAADGAPLGSIFQVATGATTWEVAAGDPSRGEFLVAWHSQPSNQVRVRRYAPDGTRLATAALGRSQEIWRLRANHQGDLVFLWTEGDGDVRARLLSSNAVFQGPPFPITRIVDDPWLGDIAISDTGRIFATWIAQGEVTTPGGATHRPVVGRIWRAED